MFQFRLQKILEYRETQEAEAKRHFLERRAATLEAEGMIASIKEVRRAAIEHSSARNLGALIELEARLIQIDDEERFAVSALSVIRDEEATAETLWHERHRDAEAIRKLRAHAMEEWELSENRREQKELDEWSVLRRAA
jgi:flagellar export protein FliJ